MSLRSLEEFPRSVQDFVTRNERQSLDPQYLEREAGKDAHWIYEESGLPWLKLAIEAPYAEMFQEALAWTEHMIEQDYPTLWGKDKKQEDAAQQGWKTICLHAIDGDMHKFDRANMYGYDHEDSAPYQWTEVAHKSPVTKAFLESFPYAKLYRARFTMLEPGGFAAPHIGRKENADYSHKISFALNHPEGFAFLYERHGCIPWRAGRGFLLNVDENYHCVLNRSNVRRIHLITMGRPDWEKIDPLFKQSYYDVDPRENLFIHQS